MVEVTRTEAGLSGSVDVPIEYELVLLKGGSVTRHRLPAVGVVTVGRGGEATVLLDDRQVSRVHLAVHCANGVFVEDLGSRNGSFINQQKLEPGGRVRLGAGEVVQLGSAQLMVQLSVAAEPPWDEERLQGVLRANGPWTLVVMETPQVKDRLGLWRTLRQHLATDEGFAEGHGRLEIAIHGGRGAAERFIANVRPLLQPVAQVASMSIGAPSVPSSPGFDGDSQLICESQAMRDALEALNRAAKSPLPVVLLGETGVGKDVCARHLHRSSGRSGPFFSVNCAALSEPLLESELFGHERGAFTGAIAAKAGLLEAAAQGTFFLDELGELPLGLQAKLLHAIEHRELRRVGSVKATSIDVRFVAATNKDLEAEVRARRFREDLYFRLAAVVVKVPPLRERLDDVVPMATAFLAAAARGASTGPRTLSGDAITALRSHSWPGNVRQLKHVMEAAAVMARGAVVTASDLRLPPVSRLSLGVDETSGDEADRTERARILRALEQAAGNQSEAARQLGVSRSTLVQRIIKYGLPRPRK